MLRQRGADEGDVYQNGVSGTDSFRRCDLLWSSSPPVSQIRVVNYRQPRSSNGKTSENPG
jgi:hypothetical protein